jgi:hypothetical protein
MNWLATYQGMVYTSSSWVDAAYQAFAKNPRARSIDIQRWDAMGDGRSQLGYVGKVNRTIAERHYKNCDVSLPN